MKKILFLTLLCLVFSAAQAKTLYVDINAGSDDVSYESNSSSNPWASLGRAAWGSTSRSNMTPDQAARAGDVVIVRPGNYNTSSGTGERYLPIYNPANSGTSGSPIEFRAEGRVVLSSNTTTEGEPLIGTSQRSYITWDGFILNENNINTKADTGPIVVWDSDNVTIQNLTVNGITSSWNDNHNAIRIEYARDSLIRNNTLSGTRNAGMNRNGSAIMLYYSNNITIEHNEISDSGGGIFVKGANGGPVTVRFNYLHNLDSEGVAIGGLGTSSEQHGGRIYQNIIRDSVAGVTFIGYDSYSPANIDVVNNTIHNCSNGGIFLKPSTNGYRDLIFANNIIVNNSNGIQGEDISDLSHTSFHNNLYFNNSSHSRIAYTNYTLSTWQSNFNQDTSGSVIDDPLFTDLTENSFTLAGNSPAINTGVDILNLLGQGTSAEITMGARITGSEVIGVTSSSEPPNLPAPPSAPVLY
jgi:parallel beta-helix repeat protein